MHSTRDNLENPMKVDTLVHPGDYDAKDMVTIQHVTREQYNLISVKDPNTMYVISDVPGKVYFGETEVNALTDTPRYLLGIISKPKISYIIYLNEPYHGYPRLIPVATFYDPQKAITVLNEYNKTGSHHDGNFKIRRLLIDYVNRSMSTHEFIMLLLSTFGYKNTMEFQTLQYQIDEYTASNYREEDSLNSFAIQWLKMASVNSTVASKYWNVYVLLEGNNFFRDKKYTANPEAVDFSSIITTILNIF